MQPSKLQIAVTGLRGFPNVQGGIETHCEQLYPRIAQKGCEVTIFARKPYMSENCKYRGVSLNPYSCSTNKFLEAITHTFRSVLAARSMKPDVLHIHAIGPSFFALLAKVLGMKVIMTTHGPDYKRAKWPPPAKAFLKFCERMGVTFADEVIAISGNIAEDIRLKYGKKCHVIPNGVEIPSSLETMGALIQFGLEKEKYILSVGRLVPEKGFHDLIDAFCRVSMEGWKLVIVGGADHEDNYSRGLREKASRNAKVVLTGFLKGMPLQELYSHAGLFVIPSYYEGLSIVLLEAMSYGLSCIASDIPANRNVKLNSSHFFKTGDINELAAKISEFAIRQETDDEKKAQIDMIAREYNWDTIAAETLKVYERVLAGHSSSQQL